MIGLPFASELYEEMQKTKRYVKAAKRFRLFLLLHYNPSLRRLRKHTLLKDKEQEEAEAEAEATSAENGNELQEIASTATVTTKEEM